MEPRLCFPGEALAEEGESSDELLLVDRGEVSVEVAGRTVRTEEAPGARVRLTFADGGGQLPSQRRSAAMAGSPLPGRASERRALGEEKPGDSPRQVFDEEPPEVVAIGEGALLGRPSARPRSARCGSAACASWGARRCWRCCRGTGRTRG